MWRSKFRFVGAERFEQIARPKAVVQLGEELSGFEHFANKRNLLNFQRGKLLNEKVGCVGYLIARLKCVARIKIGDEFCQLEVNPSPNDRSVGFVFKERAHI